MAAPAPFDGGDDFQEEDIWAVMKPRDHDQLSFKTRKNFSGSPSSAWRFSDTSRGIPRSTSDLVPPPQQSSAPVNVPDWSKILKKPAPVKRNPRGGDDDDDEDDETRVPPHEYLARRLASTQIASYSMCEGVGRTLKGRDLSNLRNAILTKTGFLE
ncbi:hypothetical protein MIMGU_mgv1a024298mg [Erythranthe guttata]|uniref:Senescence regulator n=2 Tax=Erythranthe guttata TaxID=4155 RepID=A0A022QKI0_ERYGU|nr:hypothetical protein MIMGU_mgv1a024298mg [Erythranthe guttata]